MACDDAHIETQLNTHASQRVVDTASKEEARFPLRLPAKRRDATRGKKSCSFRESTGSGRVSLLAVCFVALARKEVLLTQQQLESKQASRSRS